MATMSVAAGLAALVVSQVQGFDLRGSRAVRPQALRRSAPTTTTMQAAATAECTGVARNANFGKLQAGYLFPEIARRRNAFLEKNPGADIISLGIGDTTQPIPDHILAGLLGSVKDLGVKETYSGYGAEQGQAALASEGVLGLDSAQQERVGAVEQGDRDEPVREGAREALEEQGGLGVVGPEEPQHGLPEGVLRPHPLARRGRDPLE